MAFSNFFIIIPVVYLVSQIDFTVELNVLILRAAFFGVHIGILFASYLLYKKIKEKNDKTPVKPKDGEETTVVDHDIGELKKYLGQIGFSMVFVGILHFYVGLFPPLAVQCALNPMNFYNHNLFKVYFLNKDTPELRKRPWIAASPFGLPTTDPEENEDENIDNKDDDDEDKKTLNKMQKTMDIEETKNIKKKKQ